MKHMPSRDISGKCEGECRNLVREGEEKRQKKVNRQAYSGNSTRSVSWAKNRDINPGFFGGHV